MSSSAISSHSSQPSAHTQSSSNDRLDSYERLTTEIAQDLPNEEEAEQRLFIQNKKKELEVQYKRLEATGRDALWISREMDFFWQQALIDTEANKVRLGIASKRRFTETAARNGLAANVSSAKDDLKDYLARKEVSKKEEALSENAIQKWRAELTDVSPSERRSCSGLVNLFEKNLKESQDTHFYGKISEEKGIELLSREIALDNKRFEHRCPRQTETQTYVEKVKDAWAYSLTLAASDKKKACERQIEKSEKELDALEANRDPEIPNFSAAKYGPLPEAAEKYTKQIEEKCF